MSGRSSASRAVLYVAGALLLSAAVGVAGCRGCEGGSSSAEGAQEEERETSAAAPIGASEARFALRSGRAPVDRREAASAVADARLVTSSHVLLSAPIPDDVLQRLEADRRGTVEYRPRLLGDRSGAAALDTRPGAAKVYVRLVGTEPPEQPVRVWLGSESRSHRSALREPWAALEVEISGAAQAGEAASLERSFWLAFASNLPGGFGWFAQPTPAQAFMIGRARALGGEGAGGSGAPAERPRARGQLADAMALYTGVTSVEEALQTDRGLRVAREAAGPEVALSELPALSLPEHPWEAIQRQLARAPVVEPLAALAPADALYVHFRDAGVAMALVTRLEEIVQPAVQVLEERAGRSRLIARIEEQLGVERSALGEALGARATDGAAFVADDPFLREGAAVALMLRADALGVVRAALDGLAARARTRRPDATPASYAVGDVTVQVLRTADRALCQHRFEIQGAIVLSNSRALVERIVATAKDPARSLASSEDFRTFRALWPHDAQEEAFGFLSDAFVLNAVSARTKVLASRRVMARAELAAVAHAALLYGRVEGRPPPDLEALLSAGYLQPEELQHRDGSGTITLDPQRGPRSEAWGSLAFMTPLSELPLERVTEVEALAYAQFRETYQDYWRAFVDPVGVRLRREVRDGVESLTVEGHMMPIIAQSDYDDLREMVGDARISSAASLPGAQWSFAVGERARLRGEIDAIGRSIGGKELGIGWLGSWVALGALDTWALWDGLLLADGIPELPLPEADDGAKDPRAEALWSVVAELPVWAAAHVKSALGLASTLTALRSLANQAAPGLVEWGEADAYRGVPIVRIRGRALSSVEPGAEKVALHYATPEDVFVAALDERVMRALVDAVLDGKMPKAMQPAAAGKRPLRAAGGQAAIRLAPSADGPFAQVLAGVLEREARAAAYRALLDADTLVRGLRIDPSAADTFVRAAEGYLGYVPGCPHGDALGVGTEGELECAAYGSIASPRFPSIPVAGSPISALVESLRTLQMEVGFEGEGVSAGVGVQLRWERRLP